VLPLQYTKRWQVAGIAILLAVLVFALLPPEWLRMGGVRDIAMRMSDKSLHGVIFAFVTVWFCGQYARGSYWRVAVGLLLFGVLIEACQRMLAYRDAESLDLLADAVGIAIGLAIAMAGAGGWSLRAEQWLLARR
jgi:hypothetical protein